MTEERQDMVPWQAAVVSAKKHFNEIAQAEGNIVTYKKEAMFALQAIKNSEYLQKCDPRSIQDAVINVASIGLSLNSAEKLAYLVPRDGKACLDVSYKGLVRLATDSGSLEWAQAVLVYENDEKFEMHGIEKMPFHKFDPFSTNRGEVVGGYCAAKLHDGTYLIDTMSREELDTVRATSKSEKSSYSPWNTFPQQMMKKTLIKRASHTWPSSKRLDTAVEIINQHEGLEEKYLNGTANQIDSTVEVNAEEVAEWSDRLKELIDADIEEDEKTELIRSLWDGLNNDEQMRVLGMLKEKAPDSGPKGRYYSTILSDYTKNRESK